MHLVDVDDWAKSLTLIKMQQRCLLPRTHSMLTRAVSTNNARLAVLDTHELFHMILTYLSVEDLVRLRRVSKCWNNVILTSTRLRRILFLEAEPVRESPFYLNLNTGVIQQFDPTPTDVIFAKDIARQSMPSILNSYFFHLAPNDERPSVVSRAGVCEHVHFHRAPAIPKLWAPSLVNKMYLTQPPVSRVEMFVTLVPLEGPRKKRLTTRKRVAVRREQGVRFGDLLHAVVKTVGWPKMLRSRIDVTKCKKDYQSMAWMIGAIFVSEDDRKLVEICKAND